MIKIFSALKAAIGFAIRRPKDAIIIFLLILLAISGWRFNREKRHAQELAAKIEGLPPNTKQVVTIYRDRVITKWRDGPTKVEYQDRYLPPEGHVELITKENQSGRPPDVIVKDRGFTRRLGGGMVYSDKFLPLVDLKWAYWRRYSAAVGLTPQFGGLGLSRHIDDFLSLANIELMSMVGLGWNGNTRIALGVRTNF